MWCGVACVLAHGCKLRVWIVSISVLLIRGLELKTVLHAACLLSCACVLYRWGRNMEVPGEDPYHNAQVRTI